MEDKIVKIAKVADLFAERYLAKKEGRRVRAQEENFGGKKEEKEPEFTDEVTNDEIDNLADKVDEKEEKKEEEKPEGEKMNADDVAKELAKDIVTDLADIAEDYDVKPNEVVDIITDLVVNEDNKTELTDEVDKEVT